jgi:hypothetical protein
MTITEMHSWFKLLLDKYDTPYYTSTEIDSFITRAMNNWVNQNVFVRREEQEGLVVKSASEFSSNWEMLVYPLIHADINITSNPSNLLTLSAMEAAIPAGTKVNAILAVTDSVGNEVEFVRHNDHAAQQRNYFTRPNISYRVFRVTKDGLLLSPTGASSAYKVSLLRTPVPVSMTTPTHCELPVAAHEKIIAMAVDLAKFPMEDNTVGGISQTTV